MIRLNNTDTAPPRILQFRTRTLRRRVMNDKQRIRTFLVRSMRHGKSRCAAIVEVDSGNNIIYAYVLYIEDASRSELYRAYSEWLLDYVNDGELIEVRVADLTANDPKRGQPYTRIKYFNNRNLIKHSFLNWIAAKALDKRDSGEVDLVEERRKQAEKEIRLGKAH